MNVFEDDGDGSESYACYAFGGGPIDRAPDGTFEGVASCTEGLSGIPALCEDLEWLTSPAVGGIGPVLAKVTTEYPSYSGLMWLTLSHRGACIVVDSHSEVSLWYRVPWYLVPVPALAHLDVVLVGVCVGSAYEVASVDYLDSLGYDAHTSGLLLSTEVGCYVPTGVGSLEEWSHHDLPEHVLDASVVTSV